MGSVPIPHTGPGLLVGKATQTPGASGAQTQGMVGAPHQTHEEPV